MLLRSPRSRARSILVALSLVAAGVALAPVGRPSASATDPQPHVATAPDRADGVDIADPQTSDPTTTDPSTLEPAWSLASTTTAYKYVSTRGSNTASGSSLHPWRTIQHAVNVAAAGTTILVRTGTYAHFVMKRSGLTVAEAAGHTVVVSGGTNVIRISGVSSAVIRGLTIRAASVLYGAGVRVENSRNVRISSNVIRDNHSFGIKIKDSTSVRVTRNEITKNDTGIELSGADGGTLIDRNRIHHNDRMVTSSRGGNAIAFSMSSGQITVAGNSIWGNRAKHLSGGGYDGGAFEVYGSSDLVISGNKLWNNNNVMETGTDGTSPCNRITFDRNVVFGAGTVVNETQGMILRCAADSLIANNTFDAVDSFAFYVQAGGAYSASIDGLRIENNIVSRGRSYSLTAGVPTSVGIDYNLSNPGSTTATYGGHLAYVEGHGNTDSLAEFRSWTNDDLHGLVANPRFVDRLAHDYRLTSTSPAIDRGTDVLNQPYSGTAPDLGRYERAL